jgi:cryptochrome
MASSNTTTTSTTTAAAAAAMVARNGMHWFRKGLRLTDNPALCRGISQYNPRHLYPVYILDGDSYALKHCNVLRAQFLIECLQDLDQRLRQRGSRLYVVSGDPVQILPQLWKEWNIQYMSYERDESGEPYAYQRDQQIEQHIAPQHNVQLCSVASETIFPLHKYVEKTSKTTNVPVTMGGFQSLFKSMGPVPEPLDTPNPFPSAGLEQEQADSRHRLLLPPKKTTDLPWPRQIPRDQVKPLWGPDDCKNSRIHHHPIVRGGETLALQQLDRTVTARPTYVAQFSKPETSCTVIDPSTTVLSPYLSAGCISPRTVWYAIDEALARSNQVATQPPVSLQGQLLWRDFNNLMAQDVGPGNWNVMKGNKHCRYIPWDDDPRLLQAWCQGQTGYPWIDACMKQLETQGWIHHLGRHAVACFLTRGDLWQSWEQGALHFESHLLDADYALNGFNWIWLSCSGFFYQYFRCYSPIAFQKKNDPSGRYIRKFLPQLANLPDKYIYEPWKAPIAVQKQAGVIIGKDYPEPIVDHAIVSKENMNRMKAAYDVFNALKEEEAEADRHQTTKAKANSKRKPENRKTIQAIPKTKKSKAT